jgi:transcriptional regulator with XRE-family HTH domain
VPVASSKEERPSRVHRRTARFAKEAKALGARVRSLRDAAGLTLEDAAERCSIDWKHLQKIERGALNVTLVTLVRLAVGLGVEMGALFAEGELPPAKTKRPAKKRGFVVTPRS